MRIPTRWRLTGLVALTALAPLHPRFREVQHETPPSAGADDHWGWALAVDGPTVATGAPEADDHGDASGAVEVYERASAASPWVPVRRVSPSDGAADDNFGFSVALSGDTLAASSPYDDEGADSGSVYVFRRDQGGVGNWGGVRKVMGAARAAGDHYGWAVALDGDLLVVGSLMGNGGTGAASVHGRDVGGPDNWGLVKTLLASDAAADDRFGRSVSVDGDTVLVTADGNDDAGSSSGAAYVFQRDQGGPDNWGEVTKLTASDAGAVDHFGIDGVLDGDTVVVAAHRDNDGGTNSGAAYVFERDLGGADAWGERTKLHASDADESDFFGRSIALHGDRVVVGAYGDEGAGVFTGSAYVFERDRGGPDAWGEAQKLEAEDLATQEAYGWSVEVQGPHVLVGAPHIDDAAGATGSFYVHRPVPRTFAAASPPRPLAPFRVTSGDERVRILAAEERTLVLELDARDRVPGPVALWITAGDRGLSLWAGVHRGALEVLRVPLRGAPGGTWRVVPLFPPH